MSAGKETVSTSTLTDCTHNVKFQFGSGSLETKLVTLMFVVSVAIVSNCLYQSCCSDL
jgi:hypothetical protein